MEGWRPPTRPTWPWSTTRAYGFHAEACARGILALLEPVLRAGGTVLELGCGSGALTRRLVAAGHRVVATDASPAMLDLARDRLGDTAEVRRITLPDDPLPPADAVVAIGHPFNYLADAADVDRALVAAAAALRPGGILAIDLCDLSWAAERRHLDNLGRSGPDWAIITEFSIPSADRYVRDLTTFVPDGEGRWRRSTEHHENVLVDTSLVPGLLARHGVDAEVRPSFGDETLPVGLHAVVGRRRGPSSA